MHPTSTSSAPTHGSPVVRVAPVLVQLNKGREGLLAQTIELLGEDLDLLGVFPRGLHERLPRLDLPESGLRGPNLTLVLLDAATTTDDAGLLAILRTTLGSTALGGPQSSDVLALDDVLLQFVELLLQHGVLLLPELRGVACGGILLLHSPLLLCAIAVEVLDLALKEVCVGLVAALLTTLEKRLQALSDAKHVYIFGALFEVCRLKLEHLVLPLDQAELLSELLDGFQGVGLVLAEFQYSSVP
mmetsp:Transcript_66282/g.215663  ORF Transcript_66282/g.215663 Transcript_66282/m.215663 type:complete len:244 (+) Transcript_66282:69-800(+)